MSGQGKRFIAKGTGLFAFFLACGLSATDTWAQPWTSAYTSPTATGDCSGLNASLTTNFTLEPVVSRALFPAVGLARIGKIAFHMNGGKADMYMAEKGDTASLGRILYYNATANTVTSLGAIDSVYRGFYEAGVWGIAMNPATFDQDRFLYAIYAFGSAQDGSATTGWRVSRFKLDAVTKALDNNSEKVLLHIPAGNANRYHTGGSLRFDNFGHLYVTLGDNEALARGAGNTADYRGGILRITPDSTAPRGYTIPEGNFGEYWGQAWEDSGYITRAIEYRDTSKVKPEIYVKGARNPYSFGLDPNRLGWVTWSECGPDVSSVNTEEHNFSRTPAFSGWPFWAGDSTRLASYASDYNELNEPKMTSEWSAFNFVGMSRSRPINNWSYNTGVDTLPPMHQPTYTYPRSCAQGGPFVRYDSRIENSGKMPPHLDNVMMFSDFSKAGANNQSGAFWAVKIDTLTGARVGSVTQVFTMNRSTTQPNFRNPIDFQQGPDGMLYVVDWGAGCCNGNRAPNSAEGVSRIRYTGTCNEPNLSPVVPVRRDAGPGAAVASWLKVRAGSLSVRTGGRHAIRILDLEGRQLHAFSGEGPRDYALPELKAGRVYVLRAESPKGRLSRMLGRP